MNNRGGRRRRRRRAERENPSKQNRRQRQQREQHSASRGGNEPGLEFEDTLQGRTVLAEKVIGQATHAIVLGIVEQRTRTFKITAARVLQSRHYKE